MTTSPVGAVGQVDRLLRLVPMLYSTDELRLTEAAELLGVSAQQVVKDLKVLFMCGLPGGYPDDLIDVDLDSLEGPDGDGVIRISNADYLSRPLRLAPVEAAALSVALHSIGSLDPSARDVVERTLAKLERATHGPAPTFAVAGEADRPLAWRAALTEAIRADRRVRLDYWVATRDEVTAREVDPVAISEDGGSSYLRAWCHSARAMRSFRLDRVIGLKQLETARTVRTDLSEPPRNPLQVTLWLDAEAAWFPRYYRVDEAEEMAEGGVRVRLQVWDHEWLSRVLLRLSPHVLHAEPAEVRERFSHAIAQTLAHYRPEGVTSPTLD